MKYDLPKVRTAGKPEKNALALPRVGKLDPKATAEALRKLDWKKAAIAAAGTAAVVSAVNLAGQYCFYQGILSRELKRQLRPLHQQLDDLQTENRQLRRELQELKKADTAPETEPSEQA